MLFLSTKLFSWRQIIVLGLIFAGVFFVLQRSTNYICSNIVKFDCPYYFPMSIFTLRRPTLQDVLVLLVVVAAFFLFYQILATKQFKLSLVILFSSLLIFGSNAVQGIDNGIYAPVAGDFQTGILYPISPYGKEYYHDALDITNPIEFLQTFNRNQTKLQDHSITHPPGAILLFYFLEETLGDAGLISLFIMLTSVGASVFFVYKIAAVAMSQETAKYVAFLFALLPAVQIYYLTTLDAVIVSLLTATLYLFCFGKNSQAVAGAVVTLTASFFLTFVSLFILPVLVGYELLIKKSLRRSVVVIGGVLAVHVLLYYFFNYNAWQSFRTASRYENPFGFMLFVNPINYFFTRVEDVAEILFFFGPFLLYLLIKSLRGWKFEPIYVLTLLGCGTLGALYLTGAFRTGETARACAFIYPYLLLPIGIYLDKIGADAQEKLQLAALVFAQAVIMQTFGYYGW